jgi:hypothetical protein
VDSAFCDVKVGLHTTCRVRAAVLLDSLSSPGLTEWLHLVCHHKSQPLRRPLGRRSMTRSARQITLIPPTRLGHRLRTGVDGGMVVIRQRRMKTRNRPPRPGRLSSRLGEKPASAVSWALLVLGTLARAESVRRILWVSAAVAAGATFGCGLWGTKVSRPRCWPARHDQPDD